MVIEDNPFEDNLLICQNKDEKICEIKEILNEGEHGLYVDNKRQRPIIYQEGDYVVVKNFDSTAGESSKLIPKFKGPYVVSNVLGNDRYLIRDVKGFQRTQKPYEGIWAVHNVKPWLKTKDKQRQEDAISDNESGKDLDITNEERKTNKGKEIKAVHSNFSASLKGAGYSFWLLQKPTLCWISFQFPGRIGCPLLEEN